jgi:surface antigen Omp85-like protein
MWRVCLISLCVVMKLWAEEGERVYAGTALEKPRPPQLETDEAPTIDRAINNASRMPVLKLLRGAHGFRPKIGSPVLSSGPAGGIEYRAGDPWDGQVLLRTSGRISVRRYIHTDAELALPRLAGGRIFVDALATYRDYPQLRYFGQGQNSGRSNESNFRLKSSKVELSSGIRPVRILRLGLTGGYERADTLAGTSSEYPSIELQFPPRTVPGFALRNEFATTGAFAEVDYTDQKTSPRRGGIYSARLNNYVDQNFGRYSFRRLDVDLRQFVQFFNEQRVIALRAHGTFSDTSRGLVPFFLQPTLGGPETLRGFRNFRFYDNNAMFFNAEYRWKVSTGMEMALFTDAGKVFPDRRDINLSGLLTSYGGGVRFNLRQSVFMRVDTGCGREGCQVWLRFQDNY